jgi:hypothetical protein
MRAHKGGYLMPGHDEMELAAGHAPAPAGRPRVSRRSLLRGAGVAGLAATALAGAAGPAFAVSARPAAPAARGSKAAAADAAAGEQVVVHVRDAASGEMDLFSGTRHTRLHDPELAGRLIRALR